MEIASFDYILAVEKGKLKEVYLTYQKLKELLGSVIIKNKVPIEINGRTLYKFDVWVAVFEDNKDKPAHVISLNKKRIENILKKIDERTI